MNKKSTYGQYCPLAMSSEILCNKWTLLVIREFLDGSTGFNELRRGLPLMSRTLLSNRLKELSDAGLIRRTSVNGGKRQGYRLTEAGQALGSVVRAMAEWGQSWIDVEPSIQDIDVEFLMWDVRRNVKSITSLPPRFVVQFTFPDAPKAKNQHWLVFEHQDVDLCYLDPGHEIDVFIEADLATFTKVWMGWESFQDAVQTNRLILDGPRPFLDNAQEWLGLSGLAGIQKVPEELRVLRAS